MSLEQFTEQLNAWGKDSKPFLFLVDFEMVKPLAFPLDEIAADRVLFDINGRTNFGDCGRRPACVVDFDKDPPAFAQYKPKFDHVHARLAYGDSYLVNLTVKTPIRTSLSLRDLFFLSDARYKLLFEDSFVVFSPETFVKIADGRISAYPMKGTIDASIPQAKEKVLADSKEMAEHVTIVDLIRNDLSRVACNVSVRQFRYVEEIRTTCKNLLQVSSEIAGCLPPHYERHLGDILLSLLPAGSVSGAPKCRTLEIIREAEGETRGYYTGVVGIYDGETLDSGVMIRFIERKDNMLYYRSGGGITARSEAGKEYQEVIDKVYVPVN